MNARKPSSRAHAGAALPFGEPERPAQVHTANVDGASRGNPGPASYGLIVRGPDGATRLEVGKYIGRVTNNVAEYYGLIAALDYAASHGIANLRVESDSELLVRQMQGRYKVKSADLHPLYERAQKLARGLAHFAIAHVPRERNTKADELANLALDTSAGRSPEGASTLRAPPAAPAARREMLVSREASRASAKAEGGEKATDRVVRARYSASALHPLEVLDLDEGEMVELRIRRIRPA